jgi:hypothetical protein
MTDFSPYVPLSQAKLTDDRPRGSTPGRAPVFTLHRSVNVADGATDAPVDPAYGMNMADFDTAVIQVVPKVGTPAPAIEVLQWSSAAGKFIPYGTAKSHAGLGAGKPFVYECDVDFCIIWIRVTGTFSAGPPADQVDVLITGADSDRYR